MRTEVFVVSECCPVGCGFDMLLLRARDSGIIFAYCKACGCTWSDPGAARFERGLDEITPPYELTRDGVEFPTRPEITAAGFENFLLRAEPISDAWKDVVERVNARFVGIRTSNPRLKTDSENARLSGSLIRHGLAVFRSASGPGSQMMLSDGSA